MLQNKQWVCWRTSDIVAP